MSRRPETEPAPGIKQVILRLVGLPETSSLRIQVVSKRVTSDENVSSHHELTFVTIIFDLSLI